MNDSSANQRVPPFNLGSRVYDRMELRRSTCIIRPLRHSVLLKYIKSPSLDATQPSTSSKYNLLIPRLHQHIQNHSSLENNIHSPHKDLHHGISHQFLRLQAS